MLSISSKKTARFLAFVVFGLVLASLLGHLSRFLWAGSAESAEHWVRLVDVDGEKNFPTLYSAATLLLCSGLLGLITWLKKVNRDRYFWHWGTLSLLFGLLAFDEWFLLHERTIRPLRSLLDTKGAFYFAWVIPGLVFVAIVGLAYLKFLRDLPAQTRRLFLIAGSTYIGGALFSEMITGAYASQYKTLIWNATGWQHTPQALMYAVLTTLEEVLEMAGIIIFIYTLLSYLGTYFQEIRIRIDAEESPVSSLPYEVAEVPLVDRR